MREYLRYHLKYIVIFAMIAVAVLGLPIIFPYNKKPHADKSDHAKTTLVLNS